GGAFGLAFLLRLRGLAESLDALPNATRTRVAALEVLHRLYARQAIPNCYEALGGPTGDQSRQFFLATEAVERGCGCSGGFFCGAKRRDVVLFVDGESRHNRLLCA